LQLGARRSLLALDNHRDRRAVCATTSTHSGYFIWAARLPILTVMSLSAPQGPRAGTPRHGSQVRRAIWLAYGLLGALLVVYLWHLISRRSGAYSALVDG